MRRAQNNSARTGATAWRIAALAGLLIAVLAAGAIQSRPRAEPASAVSLEDMIGQMLIVGFEGTRPEQKWPKRLRQQLENGEIGGVIFLKRNLSNARNARQLTGYFDAAQTRHPPFIAVDQEGGLVQRLAGNVGLKKLNSASQVASRMSPDQAFDYYRGVARDLARFGFNVNFGPVVDLNTNPRNPIIGRLGRSFSRDPEVVVQYARAFVQAHRQEGVITALKHFPGHGSSHNDSHLGFVDISKTWSEQELEPYARLISQDLADMVMIGHLHLDRYQDGERSRLPATFSKTLLNGVLRTDLNYDGVVISDDMEMGAIRKHYQPGEALIRAIKAGNDLLILSSTASGEQGPSSRYIETIKAAALTDADLRARITQSYLRIVALKLRYLGNR